MDRCQRRFFGGRVKHKVSQFLEFFGGQAGLTQYASQRTNRNLTMTRYYRGDNFLPNSFGKLDVASTLAHLHESGAAQFASDDSVWERSNLSQPSLLRGVCGFSALW